MGLPIHDTASSLRVTEAERRQISHQVNTVYAMRKRNNERIAQLEHWSEGAHPEMQALLQGLRNDNDAYAKLVTSLADLIPSIYGQSSRAAGKNETRTYQKNASDTVDGRLGEASLWHLRTPGIDLDEAAGT